VGGAQELVKVVCTEDGVHETRLGGVRFVPLVASAVTA
jgi:hypothetical protein